MSFSILNKSVFPINSTSSSPSLLMSESIFNGSVTGSISSGLF
jgi:hypothetical protein